MLVVDVFIRKHFDVFVLSTLMCHVCLVHRCATPPGAASSCMFDVRVRSYARVLCDTSCAVDSCISLTLTRHSVFPVTAFYVDCDHDDDRIGAGLCGCRQDWRYV